MRSGTKLFKIFGIDINIHYSWWFIFLLLTWSLSVSFFPHYYPDYTTQQYWFMGILSAVLLFVSVLLHELSHSLVARTKKIKVESITLFFFGGVAGISDENMKPSAEFQMAIAGPLFSLLLAGIFFLIHKSDVNGMSTAITFYLYQLNFILALFNLVPGFPLDGGRAFRAILYAYYKDLRKATRIAVAGGRFFAGLLIIVGIIGIFTNSGGGLWFVLIGAFLYFIAGLSYQQLIIRQTLSIIPVKDVMRKKYVTLNPETKFADFVKTNPEEDSYLVHGKHFSGMLDLRKVAQIPQNLQQVVKLKQLAVPFSQLKTVNYKVNAYKAFRLLSEQQSTLLPVLDRNKLVGLVSLKALNNRLVLSINYGKPIVKKHRFKKK